MGGVCEGASVFDPNDSSSAKSDGNLPREFTVNISREADEQLGLELDLLDGSTARISEVIPRGLADAWNRSCTADQRITAGMHIVGINGARGNAQALQQQIARSKELELVIHRPVELSLTLDTSDADGVGISFNKADTGTSLLLTQIHQKELLHRWNQEFPEDAVKVKDRIVEVNGVRGRWADLLGQLQSKGSLQLVVSRYPLRAPQKKEVGEVIVNDKSMSSKELGVDDIGLKGAGQLGAPAAAAAPAREGAGLQLDEDTAAASPAAEPEAKAAGGEEAAAEPAKADGEAAPAEPAGEAAKAAPAKVKLQIQVPVGVQPGQQIQIQAPDGRMLQIAIPAGVQPGQSIQIEA